MVIQSARDAFSPRNQAASKATHMGAVYWSRIALAALVSVVAVQNVIVHAA
jgi:hypothetical protein